MWVVTDLILNLKLTNLAVTSCTSVAPGATDPPAIQVPDVPDRLFRNECGVTNATVAECPILCGIFNQGGARACSNGPFNDLQFGSVRCELCFPICPSGSLTKGGSKSTTHYVLKSKTYVSVKSTATLDIVIKTSKDPKSTTSSGVESDTSERVTTTLEFSKSTTSASSVAETSSDWKLKTSYTPKSTLTFPPGPPCTSVPVGAVEAPAVTSTGTEGEVIRRKSCPFSNEGVAECPFLCGGGSSRRCEFFPFAPEPGEPDCTRCLPDCRGKSAQSC